MTSPLLLVTRPEPQASDWVQQLQLLGCPAMALPLIETKAMAELDPGAPLQNHSTWRAILFVSPSAVAYCPSAWLQQWFGSVAPARAWAPGPGTAKALRLALAGQAQPLSKLLIDSPPVEAEQFDSESLWAVVAEQIRPGDAVLILRGAEAQHDPDSESPSQAEGSGREWLAEQIRARQGQVHYQAVYQRAGLLVLPDWAQKRPPQKTVWLFSSSQAVQQLHQISPSASWLQSPVLATHPRIAETALQVGFTEVQVVAPNTQAIAQRFQDQWVDRI
jgi:uroporphyrinogen-III synthase